MKFKRLSLMFLVMVIAISAAQAGQGKVENNREQKRVQKKSKVAPLFQNKLLERLRTRKQVQTLLQDETCDPQSLLKGNGAGPGDGTGDPIEDPIQDRTRTREQKKECIDEEPLKTQDRIQKRDRIQVQDETCDPQSLLKGNGTGPGDGTGDPIEDPIQDRTRTREQKKECIDEDPLKTQERVRKQDRTQIRVEDEEFTIEFLMFLKSYFAEIDAEAQRDRLMDCSPEEDCVPDPIGDEIKAMLREQKGR